MYMRVEVGFPGCEKAIKAGGEALWMWLAMKAYCKVNETDGRVPACMIGRLQGPEPTRQKRLVARLVEARLVDVSGRDFMLHDYLDWEESSADAAKRRANARKRKADWEQRHAAREERDGNGVPNTVPPDHRNAVPNASVTVGGTDHREGKGREGKGKDPPVVPQGGTGETVPELTLVTPQPPEPDPVREVFDHWAATCWPKVHEGGRAPLASADRLRPIRARLADGYSVAQLRSVVDRVSVDPFYLGQNERRTAYIEPKTIMRNASKVDELLANAAAGVAAPAPAGTASEQERERRRRLLESITVEDGA